MSYVMLYYRIHTVCILNLYRVLIKKKKKNVVIVKFNIIQNARLMRRRIYNNESNDNESLEN